MAKGDHQRVQNTVDYATSQAQQPLNETRQRVTERGQQFWNNYQQGTGQNLADYNSIMNNYSQFRNPTPMASSTGSTDTSYYNPNDPVHQAVMSAFQAKGIMPRDAADFNYWVQHINDSGGLENGYANAGGTGTWAQRMASASGGVGDYGNGSSAAGANTNDPFYNGIMNALGGYGNFAQTGGFSPQDIQNIRARMIAPIRAVYSNANADVDRQRLLQHGYSPNYTAAKAKMARDLAYATSDQTTNAEADIAQMLQQGKLAGLAGLSGTAGAARGQNLQSLAGQTSLYGATPGLSSTFGQQVAQNTNADLAGQGLQQEIMDALIKGRLGEAGVPGDTSAVLGNLSGILGLISQGAGAASGWQNFLKPKAPSGWAYGE